MYNLNHYEENVLNYSGTKSYREVFMKNEFSELKRYSYLTSEIDAAYHEAALKCGLADSAMRILYARCLHGEVCGLGEVISLSGISKQTVNSALRNMEREGVLKLEPEKEGSRRKKVILTGKGKALVQNTVLKVFRIENEVFASWTEEERELYLKLTQRYLVSFKEKIKELTV